MHAWVVLFLVAAAIGCSVWLRMHRIRNTLDIASSKSSPLSQAIQELVSTAGGIYLSMIALISFLKIDIPEKITLLHVSFDPLAFIAIMIAVLQPVVLRLISKKAGE
ncbi:MAG: hypothetical protein N2491_00280 [Negativicutes bacterium]|nr:hypothetical protein [Negativicutes bacterium]